MTFFTPVLANLESSSWLEIIVVGIVAGLLLDLIMRGKGYGFVGNTLIGLVGAIVGSFIWDKLLQKLVPVDLGSMLGSVTIQWITVLVSLLGAFLLILLVNFVSKKKKD